MVEMKRTRLTANYFQDPHKANTATAGGKIPARVTEWCSPHTLRAGDGARTRDPQLGKLMLYRLSYSRNAPFPAGWPQRGLTIS